MAITTYAELKSAIADWVHRDDLTSQIIDAITMAESRLYDLLILKNMERTSTLTGTLNSNTVALPSNYISPIDLRILIDTERVVMAPALPQEMPYSPSATQPQYWAIDGSNILFDCPLGEAYTFYFRNVYKSNLSDSNTSNYLLERRPDLYLAASIVELSRYMQDAALFNTWEPKVLSAINGIKAADNRGRGIVPLRTEIVPVMYKPNIYRGE